MREKYPEATEEDATIRALIVVVLERMGLVYRKNLPDYINAIRQVKVWFRLVDLGSIDPGSNPGSPTIPSKKKYCLFPLFLFSKK